jgi:hypothetical protein
VNSSAAFRWSIAAVLLLSIGSKLATQPEPQQGFADGLTKFLQRNQFSVVSDEVVNYTPIVRATTGSCDLQIARLSPDGSNRDLIRHLAAGTDHSFVVFRGAVYTRQPVFWTLLDHFWSRFLLQLGLIDHTTPIISVAASSWCNAEELPWSEQGKVFPEGPAPNAIERPEAMPNSD